MAEIIADITVPDTELVRSATELVRDTTNDLLFDHSRRVFLFGALQGRRLGHDVDHELLYVGALFHDLGLTDKYGTDKLRFEVDGANAAKSSRTATSTARRPPSATSTRMCSSTSAPVSAAGTSWRSSRTPPGPSR